MMTITLQITPDYPLDEAWEQLQNDGYTLLYSSEDPEGNKEIFVQLDPSIDLDALKQKFPFLLSMKATPLPDIDWTSQWSLHGANFRDGRIHVHLESNGKNLILEPGPGFGDLSHPTTNLVLKMMQPYVQNQYVVDIGCGSGILSLAANALGAKQAVGIDIDSLALDHSKKNAALNHMSIPFYLPTEFLPPSDTNILILMNMIASEQKEAWRSLDKLHFLPGMCITSGLLKEERESYLQLASSWGWQLLEEQESHGWLCFRFQRA